MRHRVLSFGIFLFACSTLSFAQDISEEDLYLREADSLATTESEMKPYTQKLRHTDVQFTMVPIPGGTFLMGSPEGEPDRKKDEGPQQLVQLDPFWMGQCEVTWDEFDVWYQRLDEAVRKARGGNATDAVSELADVVTRPTRMYMDLDFGMGHSGFPAIGMTQFAAKMYCEWLTAKTGQFYRLPTEAEWEYACRAGSQTAYSFGDDVAKLDDYAWHHQNSDEAYHKVGSKKPNAWGLFDMHGNASEWVLDRYDPAFYTQIHSSEPVHFPLCLPDEHEYPRVIRGGDWDDDPDALRSSARRASSRDLKIHDPNL